MPADFKIYSNIILGFFVVVCVATVTLCVLHAKFKSPFAKRALDFVSSASLGSSGWVAIYAAVAMCFGGVWLPDQFPNSALIGVLSVVVFACITVAALPWTLIDFYQRPTPAEKSSV